MKIIGAAFLLSSLVSANAVAAMRNHCTGEEKVVWSCAGHNKVYTLCASQNLDGSHGYLQYRAGPFAHPDFLFPRKLQHPRGVFRYVSGNRFALLRFQNGQYAYELQDALLAPSRILVERSGRQAASLQCVSSTASLNDTDVINLLTAAGISEW